MYENRRNLLPANSIGTSPHWEAALASGGGRGLCSRDKADENSLEAWRAHEMLGVKKGCRNLRKKNHIGRIPFGELCDYLCLLVEKRKPWGFRHVSETAEIVETRTSENTPTKLRRCCGCTCFNSSHQWSSMSFFSHINIYWLFF